MHSKRKAQEQRFYIPSHMITSCSLWPEVNIDNTCYRDLSSAESNGEQTYLISHVAIKRWRIHRGRFESIPGWLIYKVDTYKSKNDDDVHHKTNLLCTSFRTIRCPSIFFPCVSFTFTICSPISNKNVERKSQQTLTLPVGSWSSGRTGGSSFSFNLSARSVMRWEKNSSPSRIVAPTGEKAARLCNR